MSGQGRSLFRAEALAYHERGLGPGNLVRHPAWVRRGYLSLLLAVVVAVAAAAVIRVTPTLTLAVGSHRSPTVVSMTASTGTAPPLGAGVSVGDDTGRVVAVANGQAAGTYALEVRLSHPLTSGAETQAAVLRLPAEPLAVLVYRGLVGG